MEEEFEIGYPIWTPEEITVNSIEECDKVLRSEDFEEYVTVLAERNPYAVRVGIAARGGRFIMDLIRSTMAASWTFDAMMESEGQTYEQYRQQHYSECMILRDEKFRETMMPDELTAVPLKRIMGMVGELTDRQKARYEEKTREMSEEETREMIRRLREFVDLLGWKNIMRKDLEFNNND